MSNQESSEAFLTGRGIHVWPRPDGFTIRVDSRGGKFRIERDEMDAILSLGKIRQLEYEDTVKQDLLFLACLILVCSIPLK